MLDTVKGIIKEVYKLDVSNVTLDSTLTEIGLDSLERVELVLDIEAEYDVKFTDADILYMKTINDVINIVKRNKGI